MTGAWSIMMSRAIENFHDMVVKHCDDKVLEPCDDITMEPSEAKSHGAY